MKRILLSFACVFSFVRLIFGQDDHREYLLRDIEGDRRLAEKQIISQLPDRTQEIYHTITVDYPGGYVVGPFPYAEIKGGQRYIHFTLAFYNLLEGTVDAMLLGKVLKRDHFITDYFDYLRANPTGAENPFQFAGLSDADIRKFLEREDVRENRGALIYLSFLFVFLHELGHHALGHLNVPPATLAEAREREYAADRFACDTLLQNDTIPLGAILTLSLLDELGGVDVKYEGQQTHPIPVKRALVSAEYILDNLDAYKDRAMMRGVDFDMVKDQLRTLISALKSR